MQVHIQIGFNTSLFIIHFWYTSNFETTYKNPPFIKVDISSDVVLLSNYYDCKGKAIKLIPFYMIDVIYKTVKPSHLKNCKSYKIYKT